MANMLRHEHSKIDKCPSCQDIQNTDHMFLHNSDGMAEVFELNKAKLVGFIVPATSAKILEAIMYVLMQFRNEEEEEGIMHCCS